MKERGPFIASGLVALLLLLWLGFLVHRSPRFADSLWGGVLGISGALLMLAPLAYLLVKRIPPLKKFATKRVSMRTLLAWHIYAGIAGPILALVHTGHKFESPLGIALTAMTLIVVVSGFVGRYLMSQFSEQVREKKETLTGLELAYRETSGELAAHPDQIAVLRPMTGFWSRLATAFFVASPNTAQSQLPSPIRALRLAESIADVEYAIRTHEAFKRAFGVWLKFHIVISFALYVLLGLHIWAAIHFGLRWFE